MKDEKAKEQLVEQKSSTALTEQTGPVLGFEDENEDDMIIPRVKVIQTLSPERKDKIAEEGDILNSLTKEKLNGKIFIPVFKLSQNIWWKDRSDGGGILCQARDGKNGQASDGTRLLCAACKKNEFDNSKQGKEAIPKCTKYISFFGFIAGERMPIILSFAKTNYNEGKKLYSLAKVSMQNMWNHGYTLSEKKVAKSGNEWFIMNVTAAGATSAEDKEYGFNLYQLFRNKDIKIDMEEESYDSTGVNVSDEDLQKSEY